MVTTRFSVQELCFTYTNLRKYILWALHLMEDMPDIFDRIEIGTTVQPGFDVYLVDEVPEQPPQGLIIHFKSKLYSLKHCCRHIQKHSKVLVNARVGNPREVRFPLGGGSDNDPARPRQNPSLSTLAAHKQPDVLLCAFVDGSD